MRMHLICLWLKVVRFTLKLETKLALVGINGMLVFQVLKFENSGVACLST